MPNASFQPPETTTDLPEPLTSLSGISCVSKSQDEAAVAADDHSDRIGFGPGSETVICIQPNAGTPETSPLLKRSPSVLAQPDVVHGIGNEDWFHSDSVRSETEVGVLSSVANVDALPAKIFPERS